MCFVHRKSIKKLVLKNLNSSQYSSPINKETDDLASPSEYPQNGHRSEHTHTVYCYYYYYHIDTDLCSLIGCQVSVKILHVFTSNIVLVAVLNQ